MKDFIKVRTICGGDKKVFKLVMHVDTLYIFLMKIDNEIKKEIDFCLKYSSKYLCKFYGFVEEGNKVTAMIYEFMYNGTLSDYVKKYRNQINLLDRLKILKRIIKGIEFLHNNGIIHCDIKSTNIYIDGKNKPVIGDFGTIIDKNQENEEKKIKLLAHYYMHHLKLKMEKKLIFPLISIRLVILYT